MTLYVDVLLAVNFSMDFISMFIVSMLLHKKLKKARVIISCLIGAIYGVLEVVFDMPPVLSAILCVFVSFIMCLITFFEKSIKRILISFICYWIVSCLLGGVMSILYSLLNNILIDYIAKYEYENVYNGARFFIIMSVSIIVTLIFSKILQKQKEIKNVDLEITLDGKKYTLSSLCDSGNVLSEPLTGRSVILVVKKHEISKKIEEKSDAKKRYIPYSTINSDGILKGVLAEKVIVNKNEVEAIIAPIDKESFDGYDALVPSSLL